MCVCLSLIGYFGPRPHLQASTYQIQWKKVTHWQNIQQSTHRHIYNITTDIFIAEITSVQYITPHIISELNFPFFPQDIHTSICLWGVLEWSQTRSTASHNKNTFAIQFALWRRKSIPCDYQVLCGLIVGNNKHIAFYISSLIQNHLCFWSAMSKQGGFHFLTMPTATPIIASFSLCQAQPIRGGLFPVSSTSITLFI